MVAILPSSRTLTGDLCLSVFFVSNSSVRTEEVLAGGHGQSELAVNSGCGGIHTAVHPAPERDLAIWLSGCVSRRGSSRERGPGRREDATWISRLGFSAKMQSPSSDPIRWDEKTARGFEARIRGGWMPKSRRTLAFQSGRCVERRKRIHPIHPAISEQWV